MKDMDTQIACIRLGNVHVIPITCPKIAREVLRKQDNVFISRPICLSTKITSKGYLTAVMSPIGEQWKKMKRIILNEVVSPSRHRWFHSKRVEEADNLVRYVFRQNGLVNVRVASQHYCGNLIRKMVFNRRYFGEGMEDGGPSLEEVEHVDALFKILEYTYAFCVSDYVPLLRGVVDLDGHEKVIRESNEVIDKYHDPIIEERIHQWNVRLKNEVEDLLDVFINLKDDEGKALLSIDEIKAQITVSRTLNSYITIFFSCIFFFWKMHI